MLAFIHISSVEITLSAGASIFRRFPHEIRATDTGFEAAQIALRNLLDNVIPSAIADPNITELDRQKGDDIDDLLSIIENTIEE